MPILTIKTSSGSALRVVEVSARLDDLILSSGALLDRPCGGRGTCGKCRVRAAGGLSEITAAERKALTLEELAAGWRLACQARVSGAAEVEAGDQPESTGKTFFVAPPGKEKGPLGLAIDLGSTTVGAFVVGLNSGKVYAGNSVLNRQASHGAEIMSRLLAAETDPGLLFRLAWDSVRDAAEGLPMSDAERGRVTTAVVVGNSAMHHLALRQPVGSLLRSPFTPAATTTAAVPREELAALFPGLASAVFAPLIGGFVGADALACLVYFKLDGGGEPALALDLGTNGEIMLSAGGRVWVASTAAGPAFEGVNISCGMRAVPGAVTRAAWAPAGPEGPAHWELVTVANEPPQGLAGSGLLSAIHALRDLGAVDPSGRIADAAPGLARNDNGKAIRIFPTVTITQNDVRELQKAKAAVRAGVEILLRRAGLKPDELTRVILTGSFGGRLDPADMIALGVLPPVAPERVYSIANGAGLGAALMLREDELKIAEELAARAEHVELNAEPVFMDEYVNRMALGEGGG